MLMRTSFLLLTIACVSFAAEDDADAKGRALVGELVKVLRDPDSSWRNKWDAYMKVNKAVGAKNAGAIAAYTQDVKKETAIAIRRDNVPVSGWIMGMVGSTLLWGGLAFCIGVARKAGGGMGSELPPDEE